MTVARIPGALIGTNESTGVSIATSATSTGSETDVLGDDASEGWVQLYLSCTASGNATASLAVTIYPSRVTGQQYSSQAATFAAPIPVSGANKIYLGQAQVSRYMTGVLKNNDGTVSYTNAALLYELFKES